MSFSEAKTKSSERPIGGSGKFIFCEKSETGFVGLFNQGATCYLNSMLQALYMTPQFRSSLFQFRYDESKDGDKKLNIPYQLQLLFARLATSKQPAVNTKGLTVSFHWDRAQSFEQNDVQELMKVLFDVLEKTLHQDPKNSFTTRLYFGESVDYLKSLAGDGYERRIDSVFDQIGIAISPEIDHVEKGIKAYLTPEKLSGDNRWRHPKTKQKVDAEKGVFLKSLPTVLTVTLNRFKMDFVRMTRVKINQKVTIPETIDMNQYVHDDFKKEGNWDYDLFAILMHSGTARGGHYYAYIKSWSDKKWYVFNDAVVRPLEAKEGEDLLASAHGNGKAGTSAYLLMYMDRTQKPKNIDTQGIPDYVQKVVKEEDAEWEKERAEVERLRRLICSTVYYKNQEIKVDLDKGEKVQKLIDAALSKAFEEKKEPLPSCTRVRRYEPSAGWAQDAVESKLTLEEAKFPRNVSLVMETKGKNEEWPKINPNAIPLRVVLVTPENLNTLISDLAFNTSPKNVKTLMVDKKGEYVGAVEEISSLVEVKGEVRLFKLDTSKSEDLKEVADSLVEKKIEPTLENLGITPGNLVYVEPVEKDEKSESKASKLLEAYDMSVGQITVEFNLLDAKDPSSDLKKLTMSKNKTLKQVKTLMIPILGVEHVDDFRIRRYKGADQIKAEEKTLEDLNFMGVQYLFLERGRPLRLGEANLNFHYFNPDADGKRKFQFLFQIPVKTDIKVSDLMKDLLKYLNDIKPDGKGGNKFGVKHMRIREKLKQGAGAILQSNLRLKNGLKKFIKYRDGMALCIQKIPREECINKSRDHLIFVHQFERDTDILHRRRDVVVSRMTTIGDLIPILLEIAKDQNETEVKEEHLAAFKGKSTQKTKVADCIAAKWIEFKALDRKARINTALGVRSEQTIIFSDLSTAVKSKPPEKKAASSRRRGSAGKGVRKRWTAGGDSKTTVRSPTYRPSRPERGIKIWTTAEKEEEEKKKKEAEEKKKKEAEEKAKSQQPGNPAPAVEASESNPDLKTIADSSKPEAPPTV